jgi:cbb3-type cytochrome oxidase subunit 1
MLSRTLIKLSVVYFLIAIVLGNAMGIQQDFRLKHVHVHIALLGWVSLAVVGLLYRAHPELERGWLPRAHLWLHNIGLVVFMGGFSYSVLSGKHVVAPIAIGALVLSLAVVLLAVNVLFRLRPARDEGDAAGQGAA